MGKGQTGPPSESNYDYQTGGLSYTQRVPQNLLGPHAKAERSMVDTVNDRLMLQKLKEDETLEPQSRLCATRLRHFPAPDFQIDNRFPNRPPVVSLLLRN